MPTINEYKKAGLVAGGFTGDINTAEYKWLRSICDPYKGSIPDMWRYALVQAGYSGSVVDMQNQMLIDLGYTTGSMSNKWYKYWRDTPLQGLIPLWVKTLNPSAIAAWDFANDRYWRSVNENLATATDFAGGPGTNDNLAGVWSQFAADVVRRTDKGVIIEPARTNQIRNNSMQGAAPSSTLPTNWSNGNGSGLTKTIIGVGAENGVEYIEVRINGTTGDGNGYQLAFEPATGIDALTTEVWTNSFFVALVGGSLSNVTSLNVNLAERTAAGGLIASGNGSDIKGSLTSTLQRFAYTRTLSGGGTVAKLQPRLNATLSSGVAVDFTFRVGWPQCEKQSAASSPIRTTTAAVTRAADALILKDPGGAYDLTVKFDNDSTQAIAGQSGDYAVPTNLNRAVIKSIVAVAA